MKLEITPFNIRIKLNTVLFVHVGLLDVRPWRWCKTWCPYLVIRLIMGMVAPISDSLAVSQTPVYTSRPRMRGLPVYACLPQPSLVLTVPTPQSSDGQSTNHNL